MNAISRPNQKEKKVDDILNVLQESVVSIQSTQMQVKSLPFGTHMQVTEHFPSFEFYEQIRSLIGHLIVRNFSSTQDSPTPSLIAFSRKTISRRAISFVSKY